MPPAPKGRCFRFSLRTLFVLLTLFACWLGYSTNWIRQRREALAMDRVGTEYRKPFAYTPAAATAPGLLWLLGERGYKTISYWIPDGKDREWTPSEKADIDRLEQLFPEAGLVVIGP